MKKMKHIKKFEGFKVNEEVPYNFSAGSKFSSKDWTAQEISDLESLGADEIKSDRFRPKATFIDGDSVVTVKKEKDSFLQEMETGQVTYTATSNVEKKYFGSKIYEYDWNKFLELLDKFMRADENDTVYEKKFLHNVKNRVSDLATTFTGADLHSTKWDKKVEEIVRELKSKGYDILDKSGEWGDHNFWGIYGHGDSKFKGHFILSRDYSERYSENVKVMYRNEYNDLIKVFEREIDLPGIADKIDEVIQRFVNRRTISRYY